MKPLAKMVIASLLISLIIVLATESAYTQAMINNLRDRWFNSSIIYTAIRMNVVRTASAAGSRLIDLLVNNVSKFNVDENGNLVVTGDITNGLGLFGTCAVSNIGTSGDSVPKLNGNNSFSGTLAVVNSSVTLSALPTVDPHVVGRLWNSGGTVHISAGP